MPIDRRRAIELLDLLHAAQNEFYSGGGDASLRRIVALEIEWIIPGDSIIAGTYRGIDEVVAYFARRRDLAGGTFRVHRLDVLVGEARRVAALTDGTATIAGADHQWSTVGLYDIDAQDRIATCRLLAFDQHTFDTIWSR